MLLHARTCQLWQTPLRPGERVCSNSSVLSRHRRLRQPLERLQRAIAAQVYAVPDAASTSQQTTQEHQSSDSNGSSSNSMLGQASNASLLRRVVGTSTAAEALDLLIQQLDRQQRPHDISADDAELLLERALEAGNAGLALSVYQQLCAAKRAQGRSSLATPATVWPAAALQHTQALVMGLCRQLRVNDALATMRSIRSQGMPGADEVSFGQVVSSPLPPQRPLAVVQPQEGCKVVSDSNSRFEFELFSGSVTSCSSEALQLSDNPLLAAARLLGVWRRLPVSAVHEMVVMAPDGSSRTFRIGTATADVPAQLGERVTVVCAPNKGRNKLKRLVLSTSPPGTQPGQPMLICNHKTGLAVTVGSAVAGNSLLLPRLKQLPGNAVKLDGIRQQLLAQHAGLDSKVKATMQEAAEDVRTLARLCQLQVKMQSVDAGSGAAGSAYEARIGRVVAVASSIEERLSKRLELLDGYARVMNMIEIEVEMDMQVPIAELETLGVELGKLSELESIKEEWQLQAEAQDEVERLLRTSPALPSQ
ncbi:hypothetical protein OEZ85_014079 [Tetradesmus obliquus]|uniref:Uncharacterized protein n=1 Tax=Tetradesmus obliquus TaxID=3088 RepID=A0ABY8U9Q9_TETOB|nr:hypothetical protein OEZ85_014079 [Tetradesmus obliquus]